jgi:membrane fusion protein (multidrug efflux system)
VPESDLGQIKPDAAVSFTVAAFGEERFKGAIKLISPNVREMTRDLVIEAFVSNPDGRLRPGMFAVVKLALGEKPRPVVPKGAILRDEANTRLFVVVNGQAQERVVQVGEGAGDGIAVLRGLAAGDVVVLSPSAELRDGTPVKVE